MVESFEKLNDSNWGQWRMFIKALLVKKNVWEVVNGSETLPSGSPNSKPVRTFRRKQAEAIAEITLRVEPSQLSFIQDEDPKAVWDTFIIVHQSRGMASRLALRRRFLRLVKSEGSMQNFIGEARRLALQLQEIGVTVEDEDIVLVLTGGLDSSYNNFVITLDSTPSSQLTLNYVITRLLNEESRQLADSDKLGESALVAAATPTSDKPKGAKRDVSQITCWNCAKKGHFQSNCPDLVREQATVALTAVREDMFAF
jgi:gag-polypeptide of LTR copia-type/Zinc knuckle